MDPGYEQEMLPSTQRTGWSANGEGSVSLFFTIFLVLIPFPFVFSPLSPHLLAPFFSLAAARSCCPYLLSPARMFPNPIHDPVLKDVFTKEGTG
jgi:hypothetical protein